MTLEEFKLSKELGWFSWVESEKEYLARRTRETIVILCYEESHKYLKIETIGDLDHHIREDTAIVAQNFSPH